MEETPQVYVVVRKVYMVRAGYVVLSDSATEIAGVFKDRDSAIDFTKHLVDGICVGNEPRKFFFADKSELKTKRENLEFVVYQSQKDFYPRFTFECTRESLLTANTAEN